MLGVNIAIYPAGGDYGEKLLPAAGWLKVRQLNAALPFGGIQCCEARDDINKLSRGLVFPSISSTFRAFRSARLACWIATVHGNGNESRDWIGLAARSKQR